MAIPNSIYDYNKQMGVVDLSDQFLQYHQTRRQTHKYWIESVKSITIRIIYSPKREALLN